MAEDRNDFLGMLSKIINEKVNEFTAAHHDTPIYSQADKDKMVEGAADIISKFVSVPTDNTSPDKSAKEKQSEAVSRDIMPIIERVKKELPTRPCIKLTPSEGENIDIFESKVGGTPYFPKEFPYPTGLSGDYENRPLRFLAQLNFDRLPKLEGFPEKGMLQFFCADDNDECVYGMNYDETFSQNGFRVIYHENIITDREMLCTPEDIPTPDPDGCFPVTGEFLLTPSEAMPCNADINDCRFEDKLFSYCSEECGENINTIYKLKKNGYDTERLYENEYEKHNSRIGGYPVFTQSDPRDAECTDCDTLLFQLDSLFERGSNSEIMWGDMGIANFFISKNALARCDFSKVMFNWDCG